MQRKVPFIEIHQGRIYVTKPIDCQSEILLILLNSPDGMSRKEIGVTLGSYYTQGRITQSLQELEKERHILTSEEKYVISGPGEERITIQLSKLI